MHILHRLADRNALQLLSDEIRRHITDALRRSVAVEEQIRRRSDISQFLATRTEYLQRVVVDIVDKLSGNLRRHKGMGDAVLFEIVVQGNQIQTQVFWDDIDRSAHSERRPYLLQTSVESVAGIRSYPAGCIYLLVVTMHVTEGHHIPVFQLATLRNARRAAGVDEGEERPHPDPPKGREIGVGCWVLGDG